MNEQENAVPFNQRFNIKVGLKEAQLYFVNRISNGIKSQFSWLEIYYIADTDTYRDVRYSNILEYVANRLGLPSEYDDNFSSYHSRAEDFPLFLKSVEALYGGIVKYLPAKQQVFNEIIESAISWSEVDLGIEWKNGSFRPSGAKLLDRVLVNENLVWLSGQQYTTVAEPFEKGLRHLLKSKTDNEALKDVVTEMYEALEAMAKVVTNRPDKDLSGNKQLFISKLGLGKHFETILSDYIDYGCDYRHGDKLENPREPLKYNEVEAFTYLTGLFIRLSIQRLDNPH